MRRIFCSLLAVLVCLAFPVAVHAASFSPSDTDLSIQVDDSIWYVFTRDNIENNAELEELGITTDTIRTILHDNNAYMDAVLYYDDGDYMEFFIRKTAQTTGLVNLSNYSDSDVLDFAAELAKRQNTEVYSLYQNQYKFARSEYWDEAAGYYICEYVTVVNNENYSFTFQSTFEFGDDEFEEITNIIDSIKFDVDHTLTEPKTGGSNVFVGASGGAIAGGIVGGIIAIKNKKKAKTQNQGPELD